MILDFPRNIRFNEDALLFDAVVSCTINLSKDTSRGFASYDLKQWLVISCEAIISNKLDLLKITSISNYSEGKTKKNDGQAASNNIVPIIYKENLDDEAEKFLHAYCPEALEVPMPVPIEKIAETMGLEVIQGHRITDDFSIFGQICFSDGEVEVYDLFKCKQSKIPVRRGTILIDAYTFWERNLGCVKNTIAHEVFHWHKHRMFINITTILTNIHI